MQSELDQLNQSLEKMSLARDEMHGRVLISEQIVAEVRAREEEALAAMEEGEKAMKEKLDKKEYQL